MALTDFGFIIIFVGLAFTMLGIILVSTYDKAVWWVFTMFGLLVSALGLVFAIVGQS